uniref:Transposase-associated domain-containing protein n=1 Tax=Zea mays TaxID=4577 RepID=C0PB38_MAIZE|nr:unknown [Zea mays]
MEDREWMYTGRVRRNDVTPEWIRKTDAFVERAYGEAAKGASLVPCPCSKCDNRKRKPKKVMVEHIWKNGFTPDYTRWIFHGEAHRTREEVVRQRVEDYDADAGVGDMLNDYHEAQFAEGRTEDEPEATAKTFYDMFDAAQKPLHGKTKVSQLDAIGRIMAFKSQYSMSRDAFDGLLTVIGSLLPEDHVLPKSMYEAQKLHYTRARSTSASPAIRPRQDTSQHRIQQLQTQLDDERRQREELEKRMAEMFAYMQSLGAAQGHAPPPPLFPAADPTEFTTPGQSAASNNPHASSSPSPNQSRCPPR